MLYQQIKDRVNILTVAKRYTRLRRTGRCWRGLCPAHNDQVPSLMVWPDTGLWWCFACNTGGSVIDLVAFAENIDYREAARRLAEEFNIVVSRPVRSSQPEFISFREKTVKKKIIKSRQFNLWQALQDFANLREEYEKLLDASIDQLTAEWCKLTDELIRNPFCDNAARKYQRREVINVKLDWIKNKNFQKST